MSEDLPLWKHHGQNLVVRSFLSVGGNVRELGEWVVTSLCVHIYPLFAREQYGQKFLGEQQNCH